MKRKYVLVIVILVILATSIVGSLLYLTKSNDTNNIVMKNLTVVPNRTNSNKDALTYGDRIIFEYTSGMCEGLCQSNVKLYKDRTLIVAFGSKTTTIEVDKAVFDNFVNSTIKNATKIAPLTLMPKDEFQCGGVRYVDLPEHLYQFNFVGKQVKYSNCIEDLSRVKALTGDVYTLFDAIDLDGELAKLHAGM